MAPTYYDILGVKPEATRDEIRRAYRAAAHRLHPDRNPAPDAESRFRELAEAYKTLSDTRKRHAYDARLATPPDTGAAPHYSWTNIASDRDSVAWAEEERRERRTEFDEMYDAFFGKKRPRRG
jgi:DnaJ-class molecular chaperone